MEKKEHNTAKDNELIQFDGSWCEDVLLECRKLLEKDDKDKKIKPKDIEIGITELKHLVSVLYRASLKTEEGRFPGIGVAWVSDKNLLKEFFWTKFKEKKEINISDNPELPKRDFHKLASLCISESILLLVKGDKKNLYAWGLVDLRNPECELNKSPKDSLSDKHLETLTIHFNQPGIFEVRYKGKYIRNYPTTAPSPQSLGDSESKLGFFNLAQNTEDEYHINYVDYARAFIIEHAIGCLVSRHTGGAFLFLPSDPLESTENQMEENPKVWDEIDKLITHSNKKCHMTEDARYRLMNLADWLATFADMDGSIMLNWDLDVIQFGLKTTEKINDCESKIESDTWDWLKECGTRHNSAAAWVAACDASDADNQRKCRFALVVSADGDVNAFYWDQDKVHRTPVIYRRLS